MPSSAPATPRISPATTGILLLVFGALSIQLGASLATSIMPILGLWWALLFRYGVMAIMHSALSIRHVRSVPARSLWWGVVVALPLLGMNIAIYAAFARIGVGLSVTIELIGPILLAIITARSRWGWLLSLITFGGMVLVTGPTFASDPVGIGLALLAALLWALYLVAARKAGEKLPGLLPLAIASLVGLAVLIPLTIATSRHVEWTWQVVVIGLIAGLLSSAIPYAADLLALRRLPMNVASNLMSLHPASAVLWGAIILGERLGPLEIAGLVVISLANILVVNLSLRKPARRAKHTPLPHQSPDIVLADEERREDT
ncbi:MAG: EamA family transporter [Dermabacter sp.]|nr:EamA family transporter [Dermabacter sp.]